MRSEQHGDGQPEQLGRYELLTRVAAGGMAEVFVARVRGEGGFERLVAVKRMLKSIAEEEHFAEMFLDEGRIAGLIESPNVVQIYDVGRADDGELFIAMELVRGVPLHRLLSILGKAKQPIPVAIAVAILVQAAEGLGAAHAATSPMGEPLGIVHRDVSPQNILVGIDGRVRVADFGVARAVHRRTNTSTGEIKGKLAYFAPEQLHSQPATAQSDVFALGIVAWETVAMRRLFQGDNPVDTIERIRNVVPTPLDQLRADVPSALARAIEHALAKDATSRTESALHFARALRAAYAPADASTLSQFLKHWVDADVQGLEARIRSALRGDLDRTMQDVQMPAFVDDRSGVRSADPDSTLAKMGITPPAPLSPVSVVVPMLAPPPVFSQEVSPRAPAPVVTAAPPVASRMPLYLSSVVIVLLLVGSLATWWSRRSVPSAPAVPAPASAPVALEPPLEPPVEVAPVEVAPLEVTPVEVTVEVAAPEAAPVEPAPVALPSVTHGSHRRPAASETPAVEAEVAHVEPREATVAEPPPAPAAPVTERAVTEPTTEPAAEPATTGPRRRGGLVGVDSFLRDVEED